MGRKPEELYPPFSDPKKLLLPHEPSRREFLLDLLLCAGTASIGGFLARVLENLVSPPFSNEEIAAVLRLPQRHTAYSLGIGVYANTQPEYRGDPNLVRGWDLVRMTRELAGQPIYVGVFTTFNKLMNQRERDRFTLTIEKIYRSGNVPVVSLGLDPLTRRKHPFTANPEELKAIILDVVKYLTSFHRPMLVRPFYEMNSPSGMGHGRNRNIDPRKHEEIFVELFTLFYELMRIFDPHGLALVCFSPIPGNHLEEYYPGHGYVDAVGADVYSMNSKDPRNPWFYAAGPRDILYTLPRLFESLLAIISSSPTEIPLYLFEVGALSGDPQVLLMMIAIAIH